MVEVSLWDVEYIMAHTKRGTEHICTAVTDAVKEAVAEVYNQGYDNDKKVRVSVQICVEPCENGGDACVR